MPSHIMVKNLLLLSVFHLLIKGDLYYFGIIKEKLQKMSPELKELTENCIRLWILTTLEKERWSDF